MLLAMSFGAGQVLNANPVSSTSAFEENPVAGVTVPAPVPSTADASTPTKASSPVSDASGVVTPTTEAVAQVPSVSGLCRFAAKIVAGGLPGPAGTADQLDITVTKASWAGQLVTYEVNYALPARLRVVSIAMPVAAVADDTGAAHFTIPIGPESQGGVVSILTQARAATDDACDWHPFTVDYDGPQGLVGGIGASLANNLDGVVNSLVP